MQKPSDWDRCSSLILLLTSPSKNLCQEGCQISCLTFVSVIGMIVRRGKCCKDWRQLITFERLNRWVFVYTLFFWSRLEKLMSEHLKNIHYVNRLRSNRTKGTLRLDDPKKKKKTMSLGSRRIYIIIVNSRSPEKVTNWRIGLLSSRE